MTANRVKTTTTTTGTGDITVSATPAARCRPLSDVGVGKSQVIVIEDEAGADWEMSRCTVLTSTTFSRDAVLIGSNGVSKVNFGAGIKVVKATLSDDEVLELKASMSAAQSAISTLQSGGPGEGIDATDVGFDIVVCAGQSNMAGRGVLDTLIDVADPRVWQFGGASADARYQTIFSGADPLHMAEGVETNKVGPATWFAKAYAATLPVNRRVLLVPCATGGTALAAGTPLWASGNPGGSLYENAIARTNAARTAAMLLYPSSRVVGTLWVQGESDGDANISQTAYASALKSLIAGFRSRITGASGSWFVIGGMCPEVIASFAGYPAINEAHIQVAAETNKTAFVPGPTGYKLDAYHYNAGGARILGSRMGLAVQAAAAYSTNPTAPATMAAPAATAGVNSASIAFSAPASGGSAITGYTVTASTGQTASGTASPITIAMPPGVPVTFTIAAINAIGTSAASPASNSVTPAASATAPATMSAPTATAGDGAINVAYLAPADGGSAITSYTATWSGGQTATGTANPLVITGVANGVAGTVTVRATNAIGSSAESPASNSVTPAASPVYNFEADTVAAAPAGITTNNGTMLVADDGSGGKRAHFTATASVGATSGALCATLNNVPNLADRTVIWKRSSSAGQARDGMMLRAGSVAGAVTGYTGARRGYMFQVSGYTNQLIIYKFEATVSAIGSPYALADAARYFRASVIGSTLKFEFSDNGTAWTTAVTLTDTTFAGAGGVDYLNGFSGPNPSLAYVDDITWS